MASTRLSSASFRRLTCSSNLFHHYIEPPLPTPALTYTLPPPPKSLANHNLFYACSQEPRPWPDGGRAKLQERRPPGQAHEEGPQRQRQAAPTQGRVVRARQRARACMCAASSARTRARWALLNPIKFPRSRIAATPSRNVLGVPKNAVPGCEPRWGMSQPWRALYARTEAMSCCNHVKSGCTVPAGGPVNAAERRL